MIDWRKCIHDWRETVLVAGKAYDVCKTCGVLKEAPLKK